ncbi:MAG: hypothetical protein AB7I33_02560 [Gemmatimonadales bacterium]
MTTKKRESFRITLTPEQRQQYREATNQDAEAIELSLEELEERIAPMKQGWRPIY